MVVPLGEFVQDPEERFSLSCNTQPEESVTHEMVADPEPEAIIYRYGAPAVCTAYGTQNPPETEYSPLLKSPLASGWPIVPVTA